MLIKVRTMLFAAVIVLLLAAVSYAAAVENSDAPKDEAAKSGSSSEAKVSVQANDTKAVDVLASLAKQSSQKIILESTVKGKVTLSLTDVPLESALTAACKAGNLQWRKVYISPDSKLLEQPDKFAATVRLMSGLSFPDLVVAGSSVGKAGVHCADADAVKKVEEKVIQELGMVRVYLITNDAAIAQKEKKEAERSAVDKYAETSRELMDDFMKMTPEEQEQAILAAISMYEQVDPSYLSATMQAMMKADPEALKRLTTRQMEIMFHMPEDQRRAMLRMNMQMAQMIPPELQQMLQEDMKAIMEEMKQEKGE